MTNILVVDDEREIADLIELYLQNENYTVIKCYSPLEALRRIKDTPLDLAILDVYKRQVVSSTATAKKYDVVYYSTGLNTIWIYSNAVTGTCQTISESTANPTSVTVAGNAYTLATADAKRAFSSLGSLRTGDIVTLLLGMDDQVVAAIPASDYATVATAVYGVVTGTTSQSLSLIHIWTIISSNHFPPTSWWPE